MESFQEAKMPALQRSPRSGEQAVQRHHALMRKIARGDERALEELIGDLEHQLRRYLYNILRNVDDAEEVVWITALEVWRRAHSFEGRCRPLFWVMRIARNQAYNQLRKRKPTEGLEDYEPSDGQPGPDSLYLHQEVHWMVLDKVPPIHREALILHYWFGFSDLEISQLIEIPRETVRTRLFHARKKLRDLLD